LVALGRVMQGRPETDVRAVLGRFGFGKTHAENRIGSLSGGEKARLLFALMSYNAPHLLLLDEPTNHLDMDSREALVQALNAYQGAVVMVSHDPAMIERVADRLWLVAGGKCAVFDGDLAAYRDYVVQQRRQERQGGGGSKGLSKKERQKQIQDKKLRHPVLVAAMEQADQQLALLNRQRGVLEDEMAEEETYADKATLKAAQLAHGKLLKQLETAETAWVAAQEAFEQAE
jgi:ATP-binding cassette, subfamily F, member 3